MSDVSYNSGNMTITLSGLEDVEKALGSLSKKTPAAAKVAINATAREARKLMVARAKARYAVNAAGQRHLKDLVQSKKATNGSLSAQLHIASYRNDLGYFQAKPKATYTGARVQSSAPRHVYARVLKESSMKPLTGTGGLSKGFLVAFKSGHVGMVQRVIGSNTRWKLTQKSGAKRWMASSNGRVEKLRTMGSPSATAMHNTIWPMVEPQVVEYLQVRLQQQVDKIIAREQAKG